MKKLLIALCILSSISARMLAYTWEVTNTTEFTLLVTLDPIDFIATADAQTKFIRAGESATFSYDSLLCLPDNINVNGTSVDLPEGVDMLCGSYTLKISYLSNTFNVEVAP